MQKVLSALGLLVLAAAFAAHAQVTAELVFDQDQFLRSESVPVRLRISNFSGQPLRLGEDKNWLIFNVTSEDGKSVAKLGTMPALKAFTIDSAKTVSLQLDLMSYFDLAEAGQFKASALVRAPQLPSELTTKPVAFGIITGTKLWEQEVGVPATTPPVVRKFTLQLATFLKQSRLYARVTEADGKVLRVVSLGAPTSFGQPERAVDKSSHLHVLFQNGQRSYAYAIVAPDGELIIRQAFDISGDSRPRLRPEEDGRVIVTGGVRRVAVTDLPPPE
jgi:hypothetical protein